jgi:hypothetical protein
MTTASPDDATVRRSDTIMSGASYASPAEQTDWSQKNAISELIGDHVSHLAKEIGDHVANLETDLQRKIKALELGLAQANGALDVLKGKGVPGCFNVKGTYDARSTYGRNDVVTRDSSSFVAVRDNPGACPGDGWQILACGGKRGPTGERGPKGDKGDPPTFAGARFSHRGMELETSSGAIALLQSVSVDPKNFTIKFIAGDTSLTLDLLPLFREYDAQKKL